MNPQRRRPWLLGGLLLLASLVLVSSWITSLEPQPFPSRDTLVPQAPFGVAAQETASRDSANSAVPLALLQRLYATNAEPEDSPPGPAVDQVRVGVFLINNYDLDMTVPIVSSSGKLWLRWQEPFQKKLEAANTTPADLLSFPNQIQSWDNSFTVVGDKPIQLPDGDYYQRIRFDEQFYVENLGLEHFPFQTVHLPLVIQLNNEAGNFSFDQLRLVPDRLDSGVGRFIDLNGFVVQGWNIAEFKHTYNSDFGLEQQPDASRRLSVSELIFDVAYSRSVRSSIWTLFQPLAIVMATVILSPSLSSRFWDIRIAIPATAVLTMVFLQQGYRAELPQLPFLTFIDRIYAICYLICLACFGLYVWSANVLQAAEGEREKLVVEKIDRVDFRFQCISLISLVIGGVISWYVIRYPL